MVKGSGRYSWGNGNSRTRKAIKRITELLDEGKSTKEIANEFGITETQVRSLDHVNADDKAE